MTTSVEGKVSPAFEPFLAESGSNGKREAIVVYRVPEGAQPRPRGRSRALKRKEACAAAWARAQQSVEARLFRSYQKEGARRLAKKQVLAVSSIGKATLPVAAVEVTRKTLPALADRPEVVAVLPNQRVSLIRPAAVDYAALNRYEAETGLTWGLRELGIPQMWHTTRGSGIRVAVLDTGIYGEHPALAGRLKEFVMVDPLGRRINASASFDAGGHGTHVCGTIAGGMTANGVSIGVAPEVDLLVGAVLVGDATLQTLLEGIAWAIEKGADVINMSLGFDYYEPLFATVFDMLIEQYGILPVVAIGNTSHGNTGSPGNAYNAFSVGALEKLPYNRVNVAPFSSGASLVFPGEEPNALVTKPDVVAPGAQVFSCIPPEKRPDGVYEYTYMDGTSMATPHTAGVAALLMSAFPDVSVRRIIQAMKQTALHPGGAERRPDNRWGYGLIRPLEALRALGQPV